MDTQIEKLTKQTSILSVCKMILHCKGIICKMIYTILSVVVSISIIRLVCLSNILSKVCKIYLSPVKGYDLKGFYHRQMCIYHPWIIVWSNLNWSIEVGFSYKVRADLRRSLPHQRRSQSLFTHWRQTNT